MFRFADMAGHDRRREEETSNTHDGMKKGQKEGDARRDRSAKTTSDCDTT